CVVEEITTALSRIRWLFVIARNSSFTYKGRMVDVKQVGRELGVRYALEGSVRKAANRVRVTAQLIDAVTGHHVWAERYDRELAANRRPRARPKKVGRIFGPRRWISPVPAFRQVVPPNPRERAGARRGARAAACEA